MIWYEEDFAIFNCAGLDEFDFRYFSFIWKFSFWSFSNYYILKIIWVKDINFEMYFAYSASKQGCFLQGWMGWGCVGKAPTLKKHTHTHPGKRRKIAW